MVTAGAAYRVSRGWSPQGDCSARRPHRHRRDTALTSRSTSWLPQDVVAVQAGANVNNTGDCPRRYGYTRPLWGNPTPVAKKDVDTIRDGHPFVSRGGRGGQTAADPRYRGAQRRVNAAERWAIRGWATRAASRSTGWDSPNYSEEAGNLVDIRSTSEERSFDAEMK